MAQPADSEDSEHEQPSPESDPSSEIGRAAEGEEDDDSPALPPVVDPEVQCAVLLLRGRLAGEVKGERCQLRLSCKRHSVAQKRAVERSKPYDELVQQQLVSVDDLPSAVRRNLVVSGVTVFDPDAHCGVTVAGGLHCNNSLTCNVHKASAKRGVRGRSVPFDELLRLHQLNNIRNTDVVDLDTQCGVPLPDEGQCSRPLACPLHTVGQRAAVRGRSLPLADLIRIQGSQRSVKLRHAGGYGLVTVAKTPTEGFEPLRRRYRRDGMQTASMSIDLDADKPEPNYLVPDPAGDNLARIRQILYFPEVTSLPERDILTILGPKDYRDYNQDQLAVLVEKNDYHFCFAPDAKYIRKSSKLFHNAVGDGKVKDACMVSVSNQLFQFDEDSAAKVLRQLSTLLKRFPFPLWKLTNAFKRILLLHAVGMASDSTIEETKSGVPYKIERMYVDNKPALVMRLSHFDTESWETFETSVALPMHNKPKDVDVPNYLSVYEF